MANYDLYHLNRTSGHIDRAEAIDAADDVNAVAIVRARERRSAIELWREGRKVLRLEGFSDVPAQGRPAMFGSPVAG